MYTNIVLVKKLGFNNMLEKNVKRENFVNVSLRLPKKEMEIIKQKIADERYLNVSDFCRTAIRKELERDMFEYNVKQIKMM